MKDDWMIVIEEEWLSRFGYDYEEYQGWKSYGEEVSNPRGEDPGCLIKQLICR